VTFHSLNCNVISIYCIHKYDVEKSLSYISRKTISAFLRVTFITIAFAALVVNTSWILLNNNYSNNHSAVLGQSNNTIAIRHKLNIALVLPTFTAAAYNKAFYTFYRVFQYAIPGKNITDTAYLSLLSSKVTGHLGTSSSASSMYFLPNHLKRLPESRIDIFTDKDVDNGSIFERSSNVNNDSYSFNNKNNAYDIIILGHQEYVTQREYYNLKKFVANGGTMILLDGNVFIAEVKYDKIANTITLVKGHSWAFNGKSAWRSVTERWRQETSNWIGSNYLCYACKIVFSNNPFGYKHHEEQYITNPTDKILIDYNASIVHSPPFINYKPPVKKPIIATYSLDYQKGKVIVLGIYSDDIITNSKFYQYLDNVISTYAPPPVPHRIQ
jgi:N,N-dimethylformamidase beta subunit-like protein